MQIQNVPAEL